MLDHFFLSNALPYPLLWAQHDPWLVVLFAPLLPQLLEVRARWAD
ncbi:hypothetical protein CLU85_0206 [Acidovorax sp. 69]|nr:hypothetical protein [Acidovorax sp. 69]PJI95499.1 hypothetical protein CLU85_0206 [Acidovorax sp. 69]